MISLRSLEITGEPGLYPFHCPQVMTLGKREFRAPVTLLVGENGTGKSTLMETMARKLSLPTIGGADALRDDTLQGLEPLCEKMKLIFTVRTRKGFFLRAEDFFNFVRRISKLEEEMAQELARAEAENAHRDAFARGQARMAYASSLSELRNRYGSDPDGQSHGESFLALFQQRITPGGIYLLDEPEAPLSPMRQLALVSLIMQQEKDSQFVIATHSPILMAYPGAEIWCFDQAPVTSVTFEALAHVQLMKDFLAHPGQYMEKLRQEET